MTKNKEMLVFSVFFIASLSIFLAASLLFNEWIILYVGIPFSLLISLLFSFVKPENEFSISKRLSVRAEAIYLITILAIILVFIPPFSGSMLDFAEISPLNWLRYLSALALTSFLPGYFLLKIFDRKRVINSSSITIVLSYLLSLFITFLVGFFILLSTNPLEALVLPIVAAINIALIIANYLVNREKPRNHLINLHWREIGLILSMLAVVTVASVLVMINNMPLTSGDMGRHYGTALDFSNGFPVYGEDLVIGTGGYLFEIYLNALFVLSGIPPAIAIQGLYILSFMPLLAFYSSIKVWLSKNSDRRLPLIVAVLSLLLGFGGLYALYLTLVNPTYTSIVQLLSTTTSKTYDISMRILYLPDIVAPLWQIGLPVLFALLYFLKKEAPHFTKGAIISILVILGYLAHASEIFFFIILLFVYILVLRQRNEMKIGPYLVLGLVVVALFDFIAPAQRYVIGAGNVVSSTFVVVLMLAIITNIAELAKDRCALLFSKNIQDSFLEKLGKSWMYLRWVLLYAYLLLFIIWLTVVNDFNLWAWGGLTFTPFFVLPVRLGAVGLLAVLSIIIYFKKIIQNKALLFFLILIPTGFLLEQTANYYPYYPAYRYGTLIFIGACIIAAYGFTKIIDKVKQSPKSKIIASALLGFLILSGMISTTLFYANASYYSINNQITQDESSALDYIKQNTPTNASVLTFTTESANNLENYAGLNAVQDAQRWSKLLLSTSNPYIINYILGSSNIKYIYIAQRDADLLNSNTLGYFFEYFPTVMKNDHVTIYEVPSLTPPSQEASLGVLNFAPSISNLENTTWIDDSFTQGWSAFKQYGNISDYELEVSNGIMATSVTSNQTGNIWAGWSSSGLSLNTTFYQTLSFRYHVENNLAWFTFQLRNSTDHVFFYSGHLSATDFTTKRFTLPENQTITKIEVIVETVNEAPIETTAQAYMDFIQFSAPTTTFDDDTFMKDWEFYQKYGNISECNAYSDGNVYNINLLSNQSGNTWVSYSYPLNLQTKNSILSFRYKVDNDNTWFTIIIQNASKRFFFYQGQLADTTFTTKSYPLPDNQIITRIEAIVETRNNSPSQTFASAQIENIKISSELYLEEDVLPSLFVSLRHTNYSALYVDETSFKNLDAYLNQYTHIMLPSDPSIPVESLSKWVSAGNTLIVFNTYGNGFFASLTGINYSSPLLSVTQIGLGQVLYVNSFPMLAAGTESAILQTEFLDKVNDLLALNYSYPPIDALPVYNSAFGYMQVTGDLQLETDVLKLQGTINLTNSPFSVNQFTEIEICGKTNLVIKNATLIVSPSESYLLIKPESYPIEGEVLLDKNALIVADDEVVYNSDVPVSFTFKTSGLSIYARLPSINASGTIIFDQLDVHSALYVPLEGIVQQKAEIRGNVKFDTLYISYPLTMFSNFKAEGTVLNLADETTSKPTINWVEVLSSSYNVAFNVIFFLGVSVYAVKKRRKRA
ncbi:hypothetical protein JXA31_09165 [Candidatus Bathyarchaeota archaeon]|nr:hypothetical protein [Candidatus Bathyarchaeota archaeon]